MNKNPIQGWHRADIKAGLEKRGWTLTRISRVLDMESRTAARVFYARWPAMEAAIGHILNVPPHVIWPDRYLANGISIGRRQRRDYIKLLQVEIDNQSHAT